MDKNIILLLGTLAAIPLQASNPYIVNGKGHALTALDTSGKAAKTVLTGLPEGMADTSRVYNLDEVVVVSQPKEVMSLRRQPLSSSVFTGRELGALGVRDLSELSSYVPSFVMPTYGSRLTSSMYIRGIGSRVNAPAVGIYMDGIPLVGKGSFNFHSYQLDRVDVLRGPQGTLYGMNTEGGLVRMYSKNPMTYQGTDLRIGAGTRFWRNMELAHYNKVSDVLGFSIAGFYNGQNGFFRNVTTGQRADRFNEAGGRGRIIYTPTDRLSVRFVADYQYVNQNGFPYGVLDTESNIVAAPAGNRQNKYRRNLFNTGLDVGFKANAFTFNSITSYQYQKDHMDMDQDYLRQDFMHMQQRQFMNAVTQEFTFKSRTDGPWSRTTGIYGSNQWLKTQAPVFFDDDFTRKLATPIQSAMYNAIVNAMAGRLMAAGMPQAAAMAQAKSVVDNAGGVSLNVGLDVPSVFRTPQFNLGLYHESNIKLTDRLTATLGLRFDYNHVSVEYDAAAAMTMSASVMGKDAAYVLSSVLQNKKYDDYNQLLPKIGLSYTLSEESGSNVYLTVCKGYRAGGYNIQMFSDILQTELNANSSNAMKGSYEIPHTAEDYEKVNKTISYKPEESWNYEAGAHLNLFDNRIHADLSAYYMNINNQQLSVMAGNYGFGRMMVNAGKSYSCGVESTLRGSAIDNNLSWTVGYGLTHAVFKEYKDEIDGVEVDYKDKRVPFIPMHTLSASAGYRINFNSVCVNSLTLGADVTAQGRTYWDEANTYSQPFYALLGAHADLLMKNVGLKLWCRNITDTRYNTFAFDSSASGTKTYFAQRGNPFQAGFDLSLHF